MDKHVRFVPTYNKINIGCVHNIIMNIPLFFIGLFLTFTLFLTPVGLILLYVSFKLNNKTETVERRCKYKDENGYEMNTYDEELLENLR